MALGWGREDNGLDMIGKVLDGSPPASVLAGPRTGISTGADTPWRFWIEGDPTVSPYRAHVPRRRG
ncbi:hypothetical protein [Nonomuraea dietziae]|uniref:hypothetical protein n=1 Tax=Nonomuraea dietziae TaxID=65515 RepID=UPI0031D8E41C